MRPILVSSGEPAGIGPELCLDLVDSDYPVVVIADKALLIERAKLLGRHIEFCDYQKDIPVVKKPNQLIVLSCSCATPSLPGQLDSRNASYVIDMLTLATQLCLSKEFSALVTAPVNKAVINQAGIAFTGHTEFLAHLCQTPTVVMMLMCEAMKVALVTTHLPLKDVADAITSDLLTKIITILDRSLKSDFAIERPIIHVAGLNPHAGESGYLGREEIETISPTLISLQQQGIDVEGPFPADTMFASKNNCDAYVAMYHDQGLPVLKYADFARAINVTLGLPIIRTSVDHGTALELAGTGQADSASLLVAVATAVNMVKNNL